jgi:hypothetical protein
MNHPGGHSPETYKYLMKAFNIHLKHINIPNFIEINMLIEEEHIFTCPNCSKNIIVMETNYQIPININGANDLCEVLNRKLYYDHDCFECSSNITNCRRRFTHLPNFLVFNINQSKSFSDKVVKSKFKFPFDLHMNKYMKGLEPNNDFTLVGVVVCETDHAYSIIRERIYSENDTDRYGDWILFDNEIIYNMKTKEYLSKKTYDNIGKTIKSFEIMCYGGPLTTRKHRRKMLKRNREEDRSDDSEDDFLLYGDSCAEMLFYERTDLNTIQKTNNIKFPYLGNNRVKVEFAKNKESLINERYIPLIHKLQLDEDFF